MRKVIQKVIQEARMWVSSGKTSSEASYKREVSSLTGLQCNVSSGSTFAARSHAENDFAVREASIAL